MGTPCTIIAKTSNGVKAIYVNYDGYPKHILKTLQKHYVVQDVIDNLMSLGDLSSLDNNSECPEGHSYDNPVKGYSVAYGRDRGEDGVDARFYDTIEAALSDCGGDNSYTYVWDGLTWEIA